MIGAPQSSYSAATAHDASRAFSSSARLVRITGHCAPRNDTAGLRMRHERQLLRQHVARFKIGHDENVGAAGHQRFEALRLGRVDVHGVVHRERAIDDAAADLSALGHLRQDRGIERRRDLRVHRLYSRQHPDLRQFDPECQGEIDRIRVLFSLNTARLLPLM